ncbi:hypothetical protein BJV82DRAFT_669194 [Fennellomyces sp. T-0311]|nr:hypothetical protein BJV82DRAFT_669194 [Fennellomyces sp. T-0311]
MATARFAESFWDDNDKGVQVILDKLGASSQTCNEINNIYEIRAQIEEEYGEKLLKLSQMMVGQAEEGTLGESISHIPSALETTARAHVDLAQQLRQDLQNTLNGFLKDHSEKQKAAKQQLENSKELRIKQHANVLRAKDQYLAEHTKLQSIERYMKDRRAEIAPDELRQVQQDIDEQRKLLATADQQYKHAVDVFNDVTQKWVSDWRDTCDVFQGLEETRIKFIRSSLWGFANMMSSVYIVDDQCCERIRTALEHTDVEKDIDAFISKYTTGNAAPGLMSYEDLSQPSPHPAHGSEQTSPPTVGLPPPPTALPNLPEETSQRNKAPSPSEKSPVPRNGMDAIPRGIPGTSTNEYNSMAAEQKRNSQYNDEHHDTVSNAFDDVVNMLSTVGSSFEGSNAGLRQSLVWSPPPGENQRHVSPRLSAIGGEPAQPQQEHVLLSPGALANAVNAASNAAPSVHLRQSMSAQTRQAGRSSPSNARNIPSPEQSYYTSPPPESTRKDKPPSVKSNEDGNSNNLRFKPIPNPTYIPNNSRSNTPEKDPAAAPASAPPEQRPPIPINNDTEEESEDEFPPLARRKPKEEKWMISSIRRPQQLPVRSQNARIYDRQSTIPANMQPPPLRIDTSAGAAHSVLSTVRAQLEQANFTPSPPEMGSASTVNNPGIRAAPWQPTSEPSTVSSYQQAGGLQRQTSVTGPRQPENDPPMPGEDYILSSGRNDLGMQDQRFQDHARRHRSYADAEMQQQQQMDTSSRQTPPKDHHKGRISLPFFGKKEKQIHQQQIQQQQQQAYQEQIQLQHQQQGYQGQTQQVQGYQEQQQAYQQEQQTYQQRQPSPQPQEPASNENSGQQPQSKKADRLPDGTPIMHFARAMWSYKAKMSAELSFNVGDVFAVIHKQTDGWWQAELLDPKRSARALVPGNYMEAIQPN